jgi:hypothetical protein
MGTNVAALWQKVVKLLQDCTLHADSIEAQAALQSVEFELVEKLLQLPTPPKAVWKKLVQQLQVRIILRHITAT